ncbi:MULTISPECIES: DUF1993 family protein [unclassified Caballeronia]|uniref:DUF1993 domain-containing protein n=1 Tax=unclassified Caballeronia TaxID=2646786 RepID=UPI002028A56A|nr:MULTISPECIES: DUF1993 domain-containing protein [unclassified Caballeronia]MDR5774553.1 DUF1993 domain-containing protein [Caballeronia sp. LZ002]MDR5849989.1 DUF1993 domain-containing protein [Caballeronia sp. LZ003]
MQPTTLLVPTFTQMLKGLAAWLDKADAHEKARGMTADALLPLRLAPDMFPLAAQVRFACFQAQEPVHRLLGAALPDALIALRAEGAHSNEQPGTFTDAKACIADAIGFLSNVAPNAFDEVGSRPVALDLPNGVVFDMTGEQYARDWALPQFYFHIMTAYAILRHHGVPLGKPDYVAHMHAYIRPGTLPGANS